MNKILLGLQFFSVLYGINPPENGKFPKGLLEKLESQGIGREYGNDGWVKKIH